jgi:hypothetical protein
MQAHEVNERLVTLPEAASAPSPPARAFLSGREDDLVIDLLAYALWARDREARDRKARNPGQTAGTGEEDPVLRDRRAAAAALTTFTDRLFHNQVEEIRHAAVREHLGTLKRPPGFLRLVLARVLGTAAVGLAGLWAMGRGGLIADLAARAAAVAGARAL